MTHSSCPSQNQIRDYILGKLSEDLCEAVAQHLEQCERCHVLIDAGIAHGDSLVHCLRGVKLTSDYGHEAPLHSAMGKLRSLTRLLETVAQSKDEPIQLRDYRLLEKIAEGGMGAVYKAVHTKLDKLVAVKVLPPWLTKKTATVTRFQREMKVVGQLNHPNIVGANDTGEVGGTHFFVMEFVDGVNLSTLARRYGRLAVADACELARQAAMGLQYAHEQGLVHRDIKPSNLMLTLCSSAGRAEGRSVRLEPLVKILDFGLVLLTNLSQEGQDMARLTAREHVVGTVEYMAPEQVDDSHEVDIRADIYSLGATLYKLLCGEAPFSIKEYETPIQLMMTKATEDSPSIASKRGDLPAELVTIVDRMLAKDPRRRFFTPAEVVDALEPMTVHCNLAALCTKTTPQTLFSRDRLAVESTAIAPSPHSQTEPCSEVVPEAIRPKVRASLDSSALPVPGEPDEAE